MGKPEPTQQHFESWIDQQIRMARERGAFDNLPGSGKPIAHLDGEPDELWWVRKKLQAEGVSITPPTIALKRERQELHDRLAGIADEAEVRKAIADLNERIGRANRIPTDGPPSTLMKVDIEATVARWRDGRQPHG